jgi:integrase
VPSGFPKDRHIVTIQGSSAVAKLIPNPPLPLNLRYHAARRAACVYVGGKRRLLGPWPEYPNPASQEVQAAHRRINHRWLNGLPLDEVDPQEVTVAVLVNSVLDWANARSPGGNDAASMKFAGKDLLALYADKLARDFRPMDLEQLQTFMVSKGHTRPGINRRIGIIRRIFSRGVALGLIDPLILVGLKTISPVRIGEAPESRPREAVPDKDIEKTLPHLAPVLQGLVRFQRLTGCRPGEACRVSMAEIHRESPSLWIYRPARHKGAWRGKAREVFLGPKAIEAIMPWLRADGLPLFSPKLSSKNPNAKRRVAPLGDSFQVGSYDHAVRRACDAAGVPRWSPNQLRKARGQELRDSLGLEASAAALGHGVDVNASRYTTAREQARKAAIDCG